MKPQTARQGRNECPQESADRCRGLAHKIMWKTDDPVARRIHLENPERMLLASFISGLTGNVRKHVRYQSPRNLEQALKLLLQFKKQKNRKSLMRVFILGLETRSDQYHDHRPDIPRER